MRVLFLNPGGDAAGGAERSAALLMGGLVERGHEVGVATLMKGTAAEAFAAAGATVVANGTASPLGRARRHGSILGFLGGSARMMPEALSVAGEIRQYASDFGADIVHSNGLRTHVMSPLVTSSDHRVVWSLRDRPPLRSARMMTRAAARFAAAVIAPSAFAADVVAGCRRPLYVISNPVEDPVPIEPARARAVLGLPAGRPIVGVIAHLHPSKGHHVAVEAWRHLGDPKPLLVLAGGWLYGEASEAYGRLLRRRIMDLGLEGDVLLLGSKPAGELFAVVDMVVHPAVYPEGFGRSIAEAQRAGVPVVATSLGGALELIVAERSGLLIPSGDPRMLAAAVERVLGDDTLRCRLQAGGTVAGEAYSPERHAARVEAVYRRVLR